MQGKVQTLREAWSARWGRLAGAAALALTLALFISATLTLPVLADPFSELPVRHWSFDSLALLVPPGLVSPSTLSGYHSRPGVMRFEVGLLVAQAVRTLQAGDPASASDLDRLLSSYRTPADRGGQSRPLSAAEVQSLRRLLGEFGPELELVGLGTVDLAAEPLALPQSASGPFVDLDDLAAGDSASSMATRLVPEPPAALAVASPAPGVLPSGPLPGQVTREATTENTPPAMSLPDAALTRQGDGPFPSTVVTGKQVAYGSGPAAKPTLAVSAAVEPGEARLPVPKLNLNVTPAVRVTGSLGAAEPNRQAGSVEVEATVSVAGVEVGANVRNVQAANPGVDPALKVGVVPDTQGYGLSLRLGQVAVSTDYSQTRQDLSGIEKRRSLELGYSFGDKAVLKAGYQLVDLDAIKPRADAVLGVNLNLNPTTTVSAGMTLEGIQNTIPVGSTEGQRASAGVELRLPWKAFLTAGYEFYRPTDTSRSTQSAATVGVGYNFSANATLLVGYRLIDFSSTRATETSRQQNLTAGVSLNF